MLDSEWRRARGLCESVAGSRSPFLFVGPSRNSVLLGLSLVVKLQQSSDELLLAELLFCAHHIIHVTPFLKAKRPRLLAAWVLTFVS